MERIKELYDALKCVPGPAARRRLANYIYEMERVFGKFMNAELTGTDYEGQEPPPSRSFAGERRETVREKMRGKIPTYSLSLTFDNNSPFDVEVSRRKIADNPKLS